MEETGIYDDLPNIQLDKEIEELQEECRDLNEKTSALAVKIDALNKEKETLQNQNTILQKNMSILLNTAKAEIKRKDELIDLLRAQLSRFTNGDNILDAKVQTLLQSFKASIGTQTDKISLREIGTQPQCEIKLENQDRKRLSHDSLKSSVKEKFTESSRESSVVTKYNARNGGENIRKRTRDCVKSQSSSPERSHGRSLRYSNKDNFRFLDKSCKRRESELRRRGRSPRRSRSRSRSYSPGRRRSSGRWRLERESRYHHKDRKRRRFEDGRSSRSPIRLHPAKMAHDKKKGKDCYETEEFPLCKSAERMPTDFSSAALSNKRLDTREERGRVFDEQDEILDYEEDNEIGCHSSGGEPFNESENEIMQTDFTEPVVISEKLHIEQPEAVISDSVMPKEAKDVTTSESYVTVREFGVSLENDEMCDPNQNAFPEEEKEEEALNSEDEQQANFMLHYKNKRRKCQYGPTVPTLFTQRMMRRQKLNNESNTCEESNIEENDDTSLIKECAPKNTQLGSSLNNTPAASERTINVISKGSLKEEDKDLESSHGAVSAGHAMLGEHSNEGGVVGNLVEEFPANHPFQNITDAQEISVGRSNIESVVYEQMLNVASKEDPRDASVKTSELTLDDEAKEANLEEGAIRETSKQQLFGVSPNKKPDVLELILSEECLKEAPLMTSIRPPITEVPVVKQTSGNVAEVQQLLGNGQLSHVDVSRAQQILNTLLNLQPSHFPSIVSENHNTENNTLFDEALLATSEQNMGKKENFETSEDMHPQTVKLVDPRVRLKESPNALQSVDQRREPVEYSPFKNCYKLIELSPTLPKPGISVLAFHLKQNEEKKVPEFAIPAIPDKLKPIPVPDKPLKANDIFEFITQSPTKSDDCISLTKIERDLLIANDISNRIPSTSEQCAVKNGDASSMKYEKTDLEGKPNCVEKNTSIQEENGAPERPADFTNYRIPKLKKENEATDDKKMIVDIPIAENLSIDKRRRKSCSSSEVKNRKKEAEEKNVKAKRKRDCFVSLEKLRNGRPDGDLVERNPAESARKRSKSCSSSGKTRSDQENVRSSKCVSNKEVKIKAEEFECALKVKGNRAEVTQKCEKPVRNKPSLLSRRRSRSTGGGSDKEISLAPININKEDSETISKHRAHVYGSREPDLEGEFPGKRSGNDGSLQPNGKLKNDCRDSKSKRNINLEKSDRSMGVATLAQKEVKQPVNAIKQGDVIKRNRRNIHSSDTSASIPAITKWKLDNGVSNVTPSETSRIQKVDGVVEADTLGCELKNENLDKFGCDLNTSDNSVTQKRSRKPGKGDCGTKRNIENSSELPKKNNMHHSNVCDLKANDVSESKTQEAHKNFSEIKQCVVDGSTSGEHSNKSDMNHSVKGRRLRPRKGEKQCMQIDASLQTSTDKSCADPESLGRPSVENVSHETDSRFLTETRNILESDNPYPAMLPVQTESSVDLSLSSATSTFTSAISNFSSSSPIAEQSVNISIDPEAPITRTSGKANEITPLIMTPGKVERLNSDLHLSESSDSSSDDDDDDDSEAELSDIITRLWDE